MKNNPAAPAPRFPKIPENISLEQILPAIRTIAKRKRHSHEFPGLEVAPGKKYLLLCDSTSNKMLIEALTLAIQEAGGLLDTIVLRGYPGMTDSVDLLDTMFSRNWLPSWVWQAWLETDKVIMLTFLLLNYTPNVPIDPQVKGPHFWYLSPDMCLPQFQKFPIELEKRIDEKNWELLVHSKKMELTDLEGTDLRWSVARESWDEIIERNRNNFGVDYYPGHQMIPLPSSDGEGKLVTSAITFGGPVSRTTMTIQGCQATRVEGEGKFADALRRTFEEYKAIRTPRLPGPGINWWTTLAIGTAPKGRVAAGWDRMTGSARMHGWGAGHSRSGIIHTSLGEGVISHDRRIIRHVDLFFPTLVADGKRIIDKGHLTALDDPEIIDLAAKYGDPADLLREDWIPAVSGVNS